MSDQISYSICTLMIVSMSYWLLFSAKDMRRKTNKLFLGILISETLPIVFSLAAVFAGNERRTAGYAMQETFCSVSYLSYYFIAAICAWYFLNFIGIVHKLNRLMHLIFYVPYLITCVVPLAVPQLRRELFRAGPGGYLLPGPMSRIALAGLLFYVFLILWAGIRFKGRLSREQRAALIFLVAVSALSNLIASLSMSTILMSLFFVSVGILVVLISVDNRDWVYSGATNAYNRMTFQRHILVNFEDKIDFDLIIIQMSRESYYYAAAMCSESFHSLMNEIAGYLKGIRKRPDVYYWEHGTFLIPVFRDSSWSADDLAETIRDRFEKPWDLLPDGTQKEEKIMIPVRIVKGSIPSEIATMQQMIAVIDLPYDAEERAQGASIIRAGELIHYEKAKNSESETKETDVNPQECPELPMELTVMLDSFEEHVKDLTPAERKIVLYYLNGYEISQIPDLDGITINTVRKHNKNIYRKLQISSREELMMYLDILERCGRLDPIEAVLREKNEEKPGSGPADEGGEKGAAPGQKESADR